MYGPSGSIGLSGGKIPYAWPLHWVMLNHRGIVRVDILSCLFKMGSQVGMNTSGLRSKLELSSSITGGTISQNEGITKAPSARRAEARADIDHEFVRKKKEGAKGTSHNRIQDEIQGDFTHKANKRHLKRHLAM